MVCLLTTGKYWKVLSTAVWAAGVIGKKSVIGSMAPQLVEIVAPMMKNSMVVRGRVRGTRKKGHLEVGRFTATVGNKVQLHKNV